MAPYGLHPPRLNIAAARCHSLVAGLPGLRTLHPDIPGSEDILERQGVFSFGYLPCTISYSQESVEVLIMII